MFGVAEYWIKISEINWLTWYDIWENKPTRCEKKIINKNEEIREDKNRGRSVRHLRSLWQKLEGWRIDLEKVTAFVGGMMVLA